MSDQVINDNLVLIGGKSAVGKSASLMGLRDQPKKLYLGCEAGKKLPFKSKFVEKDITDPLQVNEAFAYGRDHPEMFDTIIIDTATFLMDMYESQYVLTSDNTMKAWGSYAQFFKNLMQQDVAKAPQNVLMLAHTMDTLNEATMTMETSVPIKGSLKGNGVESFFSCVVAAKKVTLKTLEKYKNPLLNITPDDEALGFKYVYQTRLTKDTVGERIRGPLGMWKVEETFIDNNAQLLLDRLHEYYKA